VKEPESKKTADANTVTDVNTVADANSDPNAVRAKIEEFKGLSEALEKIGEERKDEISKWTLSREEKLDLALAVQKQITEELKLLRELAIKEGAVKTTAAINGILLDRQERFKDVIEELEKESKRFRLREEKKKELRERSSGRSRERTDRTRRDLQY
jgi:predicted RNase H-like nuclease (RuvC/YqgF family)